MSCCTRHVSVLLDRRRILAMGAAGAALAALPPFVARSASAAEGAKPVMSPDEALTLLKKGNEEFLMDAPYRRATGRERRLEIARAQHPFAVLVSCSDSRVPPELLFGRGLGELFIIRNAGNTVDLTAQGSVEYAVGALGVPLIVVLGHERCGAVAAAIDVVEKDATFPGRIGQMVEPIIPAVLKAKHTLGDKAGRDELLDAAIRENVRRVAGGLSLSELITERQRAGAVKIVGARYDLDDGKVEFFHEA